MYASQIQTVLELMERVDNRADYVDLRKIVNRYLDGIGKEFPAPKRSKYEWSNDMYFSQVTRDAGDKLHAVLNRGTCNYYHRNVSGTVKKIQLIKALRDFGGHTGEGDTKHANINLLHAKQFVEKYFPQWC